MDYVGHYSDTSYIVSSICANQTCNHVAKTHTLYLGAIIWGLHV